MPSHGRTHTKKRVSLLLILSSASPPLCPRDFYGSQADKHSGWASGHPESVTAMAVAADFHRDFLIPARHRPAVRPVPRRGGAVCVYSFTKGSIPRPPAKCNGKRKILRHRLSAVFIEQQLRIGALAAVTAHEQERVVRHHAETALAVRLFDLRTEIDIVVL